MASQDDFIRTALRVPPNLHRSIHEAAALGNRTFNAEIIARLAQSFEPAANAGDITLLIDQAENYKKTIKLLEAMQSFLAKTLVAAVDVMPDELQEAHKTARSLAESIAKNDMRGLGASFMEIFRNDSKIIGEMQGVMGEMEPMIAAKERGEDLAPYAEEYERKYRRKPSHKDSK